MSLLSIIAVSVLAAAAPLATSDDNIVQPVAFTNTVETPGGAAAPSGRANVAPGTRAPDFEYQSYDAMWQHLHNVLEHGDVLLVFGASDVDLRTLERERESLTSEGVLPLAVVERKDHDVWASVRRLGLTYSLLADPRGAVGTQYGVYDGSVGRSRSAWFVIDSKGRVRQSGGSMPSQGWPALTATALGRPVEGATHTASTR